MLWFVCVPFFKEVSAMTILNNDKIHRLLNESGLGNVSPETAEAVESILGELDRKNVLRTNNSKNYFIDRSTLETTSFLRALVEQNWLIIAQNEKIIKALNASK
ncbi:hypothetical protein KTE19_06835 [Lentilactobacillus sp. IMAU92037]|uniref:Uncharacterized protein n=2 Tax=Lactobacillaceae TaxID=33958 RepID=H1LEZ1_9LACO|nr:hypothetical protein HMPREF9104_01167 [Lentilactobacillus kisonensis F0435]MBV0930428.1 hypothetical protein [Lentilactobacillus dabitei]